MSKNDELFDWQDADYGDHPFAMEHELMGSYPFARRGSYEDEYRLYRECFDDGNGIDFHTGKPLKTFDEWMEGFDSRLA